MANVVGVHGISQQQAGRLQLLASWRPALADGVERAAGRDGPALDFDLAYYGHLYLEAGLTKGNDEVDLVADLDDDMLEFFDEIEDELVDEEPSEEAVKGTALPRPVGRLAAWLDQKFGAAGPLLFLGDLVQVRRYQRDDPLAAKVRASVKETIGSETRIVIGHSLGSVVAYEHLCEEPHPGLETLVTLGSPLALRSIQRKLRFAREDGRPAWPPGLKAWFNLLDPHDPVCCGGGLSVTWRDVADKRVDNGKDPHAAIRYLGKKQAGEAVVAALLS